MFGSKHYVPVLRWKRAEWGALRDLADADRDGTTPLFEWVPHDLIRAKRSVDIQLALCADTVRDAWGERPLFVDAALLPATLRTTGGHHVWDAFAVEAAGRRIVPTVALDRGVDEIEAARRAAASFRAGMALRLRRADLARLRLASDITALVRALGTTPAEVDLILDYGLTDANAPGISYALGLIPTLAAWRTLTAVNGAFPKDLSGFRTVGTHRHPRSDWEWWRRQALATPPLARIPAYGDYLTQHPVFSPPPPRANFSASIRYAADSDWVIMRGEGVFNDGGPGFAQWPANAQMLCFEPEYAGPAYSAGDQYISTMAAQTAKPGNAESWLRAGLSRHLTLTARQVAALPIP